MILVDSSARTTSTVLRNDVPVLAQDADMARIAEVTGLRLDEASLRGN